MPPVDLPAPGDTDWYDWAADIHTTAHAAQPTTYLAAASGDTTGDTDAAAINAALTARAAAGGGRVVALAGQVYQVISTGSQSVAHPSGSTATRNRAIVIPDGVTLDMNGSTLQLRGSAETWIVCNANTSGTGTRSHDVGLVNAVLDARSIAAFAAYANSHFSHIDRLTLRNVKLINGRYFGCWVYNVTDSTFDGLDADGVIGNAWQVGDPQAGGDGFNQVYRSTFGHLSASNVTLLNTGSQPGNPYAMCLTDCTIASFRVRNTGAGIKIQAPGKRIAVGHALLDTCGEATALNSGFKFQGDGTWGNLKDCTVGQVVAVNQASMGLALLYTENCSVGSYIGRGNCLLANNGDAFLGGGINDYVGAINSTSSGAAGVRISQAPALTQVPTGFRLPNVRVTNPGQISSTIKSGVRIDYANASGTIGDLVTIDDQATHTMSRGVDVTVSGVVGAIASHTASGYTDVAFNSSSSGFAVAAAGTKASVGLGAVDNVPADYTIPTGNIRTTLPRTTRLDTGLAGLVSGRLTLVGIYLLAGDVVTSLTFYAGSTAAVTPTNQWFSLYTGARGLLGVTADNTTTAWASNGAKTLSLTTPYTVTTSGLYYTGVTVVAATVPTLTGATHAGTTVVARPPILAGGSTTALTDPASAPSTAGTLSALFGVPYVEVS